MDTLFAKLREALADRYELAGEVGRGGMAVVYGARDLRHQRQVAVKVLSAEESAARGTERFLREIRVAAGLSHPHILPVYDSGDAGGHLFFVMPLVDGESLRQRLSRETRLPTGEAIRIAREMADALAFAHRAGVIHRDVKPENILLSHGHALVADFGIARAPGSTGANALTMSGARSRSQGPRLYWRCTVSCKRRTASSKRRASPGRPSATSRPRSSRPRSAWRGSRR